MKSDIKLKEDIHSVSQVHVDALLNLRPVEFKYKNASKRNFGFIAQEVEATPLIDIVYSNKEGIKSIAYSQMIALLVAKIQELEARLSKNGL